MRKGGTNRRSLKEERERIITVSGVFSRREQMYASTQRLPLCTELAPWWVLAAAVSILRFPWTPDAPTPAAQPSTPQLHPHNTPPPPPTSTPTPPTPKRDLKASWEAGPRPCLLMLIHEHCPSLAPYLVQWRAARLQGVHRVSMIVGDECKEQPW